MSAGALPVAGARRLTFNRRLAAWLALLLVLIGVGVATWVYQFANGLVVTGLTNVVMWGQYILFFMFFVGLSAGGLIVASAGRLFGSLRSPNTLACAGQLQTHDGTWPSASRCTHSVHFSTVPTGRAATIPNGSSVGYTGLPQLNARTPYGHEIMQ